MKRILFTAAAMFTFLQCHCQVPDTGYRGRKLKIEEVNLLSSYYKQDGSNSAITGGTGSEALMDIANIINVKLVRYDRKNRKHSIDVEAGLDYYTSASSDMIDLKANSSASSQDFRFYPAVTWNIEDEVKGKSFGLGLSSSTESDYQSYGATVHYSKKSADRNGELSLKLQAYFDRVKLVLPAELRAVPDDDLYRTPVDPRNSLNGSFSYSRVVNERLQVMLLADLVYQQGYLGLPFHRVYLYDGSLRQEKLPRKRLKIPIGFRSAYFSGDRCIFRLYYRYYSDDWGLRSHTANLEMPVKFGPYFSISPFYRFYNQSAARYFNGYMQHEAGETYYTSNHDLSAFNSHFMGAGLRLEPEKGVLGIRQVNMLELRYGHYRKSINMQAHIVSLQLRFR